MAADSLGFDQSLFNTWQNPMPAFSLSKKQQTVPNPYAPSQFSYLGSKPSIVEQAVSAAAPRYNGYGNGAVQSPDADGYYSGIAEMSKPDWASGQIELQAPKKTSYLGDAVDSAKGFFGIGNDTSQQTFKDYQSSGGTMSEDKWNESMFNQGRLDSQKFTNYAGSAMGAAQLGLGALSYFDQKAMNKKNMQLIDQQIANNQDIMKTRTERAGDIKKYFG